MDSNAYRLHDGHWVMCIFEDRLSAAEELIRLWEMGRDAVPYPSKRSIIPPWDLEIALVSLFVYGLRVPCDRLLRFPDPSPDDQMFHLFSRLPAELRLMIWERVPSPPPCGHYFKPRLRRSKADTNMVPSCFYLDDRGMLGACRESRSVVIRVYEKVGRVLSARHCLNRKRLGDEERYYRCMTTFNSKLRTYYRRKEEVRLKMIKLRKTQPDIFAMISPCLPKMRIEL